MATTELTSSLIIFIAATAITATAVGYMALGVQDMARSGESASHEAAKSLRSDIRIINDPVAIPSPPVFYAKNIGTEPLAVNATNLLVDGQLRSSVTLSVFSQARAGVWGPGEVLQLSDSTLSLSSGDHSVTVITERGVRDSLDVRV